MIPALTAGEEELGGTVVFVVGTLVVVDGGGVEGEAPGDVADADTVMASFWPDWQWRPTVQM